jgi:hypothetical protein
MAFCHRLLNNQYSHPSEAPRAHIRAYVTSVESLQPSISCEHVIKMPYNTRAGSPHLVWRAARSHRS